MARSTDDMAPILAVMVVAVAPQIVRLPLWITLWCGVLWGYALVSAKKRSRPVRPAIRQLLTFGGFLGGMVTYGFAFDMDAGVGLLAIMVGLKPLEVRSHRDRMMAVFLTYFLIIINLLYTTALVMTAYMAISVVATTAVLITINHRRGSTRGHLRLAGKMMIQALPWAVLLFVAFPRIHGNLWGTPAPTVGQTGFTDRLEPGSVSQMVSSSTIAFRAAFDGKIPARGRLYWRALVFHQFDGIRWYPAPRAPRIAVAAAGSDPVSYTITLEPHGQRWMVALDMPFYSRRPARLRADSTVSTWRPIHNRIRYVARSYTTYNTGPFQPWDTPARRLPDKGNPRARALAADWRAAARFPEAIVEMALAHFRDNPFHYTLNAPLAGDDRIDDFLFRTRKGYCEHYASAFAFLMRAAGLPCRIVGGYLGGEVNPYGNYLIVRQSDAHAWTEVWLAGKGWVRVDPTSAVAPARVERGAAAALAPEERGALGDLSRFGPMSAYWKQIQLGWDLINSRWNGWVMGYSYGSQRALFSKLGWRKGAFSGPLIATLAVGAGGAAVVLLVGVRRRKRTPAPTDAVQRGYLRFCQKLAAAGLPRPPGQGPVDYASLVASVRSDLADAVRSITDLYVQIRYANRGDTATERTFLARVSAFRPGRRSD